MSVPVVGHVSLFTQATSYSIAAAHHSENSSSVAYPTELCGRWLFLYSVRQDLITAIVLQARELLKVASFVVSTTAQVDPSDD